MDYFTVTRITRKRESVCKKECVAIERGDVDIGKENRNYVLRKGKGKKSVIRVSRSGRN